MEVELVTDHAHVRKPPKTPTVGVRRVSRLVSTSTPGGEAQLHIPGASALGASPQHLCTCSWAAHLFEALGFVILSLAALGPGRCPWAASSCGKRGLLSGRAAGLHTAAASLAAERRLGGRGPTGSAAPGHVHSFQTRVPCTGRADSYPLDQQGSPSFCSTQPLACEI